MATYSVSRAKHQTLVAATQDTVNLTYIGRYIQVLHRGSVTNPIYVTVGKTAATAVSGADDTLVATSTVPLIIPWPADAVASCQVNLISAGAESYTVQVLADRLA